LPQQTGHTAARRLFHKEKARVNFAERSSQDRTERPRPADKSVLFTRKSPLVDIAQFAVFVGVVGWLIFEGAQAMNYNWQWYRIPKYFYRIIDGEFIPGLLLRGLSVTLQIAFYSMILTFAISLITALLRLSGSISGRLIATFYLEAIRNTPLLVQLFLFYFVLAPIIGIDRFWAGVLCLSFFEGSFGTEVIRAGLQSVPRGQYEAADAIGLSRLDRLRFVVLPQAIPLILPPMTGLVISLVKHSSIVSVIAVAELTTQGLNIISETFMAFEIWFTVAAIYLVLTVSLSFFVSWLEHRARRGR
jgi:polar amino acid transport system permease protein